MVGTPPNSGHTATLRPNRLWRPRMPATVYQNDASLERLDGVRILVNGWRLSGTK